MMWVPKVYSRTEPNLNIVNPLDPFLFPSINKLLTRTSIFFFSVVSLQNYDDDDDDFYDDNDDDVNDVEMMMTRVMGRRRRRMTRVVTMDLNKDNALISFVLGAPS